MPIRIAIIAFGKIARDQHMPAILAGPRFELAGLAGSGLACKTSVLTFSSHDDLLRELAGCIDAVAVCTPPQVDTRLPAKRFQQASWYCSKRRSLPN